MDEEGDSSSVIFLLYCVTAYLCLLLTVFSVASAPLRLNNPDFRLINDVFDELGPIPRLCIDFTGYKEACQHIKTLSMRR
jgi:hypothetical protein